MKSVAVPLARVAQHLPQRGVWYGPAYQGPGGLYAIRGFGHGDDPPMFQVSRVRKDVLPRTEDVSMPFMTEEGAGQFARRMAEGGSPVQRFG